MKWPALKDILGPPVDYIDKGTWEAYLRNKFNKELLSMEVYCVNNRNLLMLKVDLHEPLEQIIREVSARVRNAKDSLRIKYDRRDKPTSVDPWLVYDMRHRDKKSLLSIARELLKFTGDPSYDTAAKRQYAKVTRAYHRAKQMIEELS